MLYKLIILMILLDLQIHQEATEQVNESSENSLPPAKQESMEEVESAINISES